MISRNDLCWCGSGRKWKKCHAPHLPDKNQVSSLALEYLKKYGIILKTPEQIAGIRRACHLAATILEKTCHYAQEGITTNELDAFAHKLHQEAGAIPAPLGYGSPPFPKSICTSLNEVICHGIPDDRPLQKGDILNIDVTCILEGYYGDCSRMVIIEPISSEKHRVTQTAKTCLDEALAILKPGLLLYEIGKVIEECAAKQSCSVVDQFVAHGTGVYFHEPPQIPHHLNSLRIPLAPGMTFTIEPMINAGKKEAVIDPTDRWTARTIDGKPSAQWEHTVLITSDGYEVLTLPPSERGL